MSNQICNWAIKWNKNDHLFNFLTRNGYKYMKVYHFTSLIRLFSPFHLQDGPSLSIFQTSSFCLSLILHLNLRFIPEHFSPTSGPASTMDYLERKLLRFQELIWCINHFWVLLGCQDIVKKVKISFVLTKSEISENRIFTFFMISQQPCETQIWLIHQINPWNLRNLSSRYPKALNGREVSEK